MRAAARARPAPPADLLVEQMWTAIAEGYVDVVALCDRDGLNRWLSDAATMLGARDKTRDKTEVQRMFKIVTNPTFTHEVKVEVPGDGGFDTQSLKATYRVLPVDEAKTHDLGSADGSTAFLKAVIVRFDDLIGEDGKPVSYNEALRDRLIGLPYVRGPLAAGYFEGVGGAKRGN